MNWNQNWFNFILIIINIYIYIYFFFLDESVAETRDLL